MDEEERMQFIDGTLKIQQLTFSDEEIVATLRRIVSICGGNLKRFPYFEELGKKMNEHPFHGAAMYTTPSDVPIFKDSLDIDTKCIELNTGTFELELSTQPKEKSVLKLMLSEDGTIFVWEAIYVVTTRHEAHGQVNLHTARSCRVFVPTDEFIAKILQEGNTETRGTMIDSIIIKLAGLASKGKEEAQHVVNGLAKVEDSLSRFQHILGRPDVSSSWQ